VYHLELRQFPHVARVFNLERAELDTRFVRPWLAGELIEHDDRRWSAERTRLKVLEAPAVRLDELGLGRGWGQVTKQAADVTEAVLAEARRGADARPEAEALKAAIEQAADRPLAFADVVELAVAAHPGWRASEQLALAEQAVWELLHQGRLAMEREGEPVPSEGWQEVVLSFATWAAAASAAAYRLRAPG
jgi:hypothetical protein